MCDLYIYHFSHIRGFAAVAVEQECARKVECRQPKWHTERAAAARHAKSVQIYSSNYHQSVILPKYLKIYILKRGKKVRTSVNLYICGHLSLMDIVQL